MIPKNLFTTWVAETPPPEKFYKCFESWMKLMPDWDIKIINLENIEKVPYVVDRIKEKNYIMASHWARINELQTRGGIYVDIDVEAIKDFEELRDNEFFLGHEGGDNFANNAIMGSVPQHGFTNEMMEYTLNFNPNADEAPNETGPRMVTKLLINKGWRRDVDELQTVDGITVYPSSYFYPHFYLTPVYDPKCIKPETVAVHHWTASWIKE